MSSLASGGREKNVTREQFSNFETVPQTHLFPGIPGPPALNPPIDAKENKMSQNSLGDTQKTDQMTMEPWEPWYAPYATLLRSNTVFRVLCAQYSISISGDALNMMATLYMLQRETKSSLALSGLLATRQLPYIIFAPIAGWLSDRFERLHVMAVCDALRMFIVLLYLIASKSGSLWLLFVLGFIQHSLSTLSDPAFHAMIPQYVPPKSLHYAHTIITTLWAIVVSIAYAVGGALVATAGPTPNIIGDSLCYAGSLGLIAFLMYHTSTLPHFVAPKSIRDDEYVSEEEATSTRSTSSEGEGQGHGELEEVGSQGELEEVGIEGDEDISSSNMDSETETENEEETTISVESSEDVESIPVGEEIKPGKSQSLRASFIEAVRFFVGEYYVMALSSLRLMDALGYGAVSLISIKLAEEELQIAKSVPATLAVMYVALGLAAFIGPFVAQLLVGPSLERTHAFLVLCTILESVAMALLCWTPHVAVLLIAAALHMAAMSSNHVTATALIQRLVPAPLYARVNALDTSASAVLELVALFVTGALIDDLNWSSRSVMLVFALLATGATLLCHALFTMTFSPHRVYRMYGEKRLLLKLDDSK